MTAFDVAAILVVLISTLIGYSRGAVREIVFLTAFGLAALAAIIALPVSGGILRHVVHPAWAAAAAAVVVVFVLAYVAVRVLGSAITRRLRGTSLGGVDRVLGGGVGLIRALIVLGLVSILLESAPWPKGRPGWLENAVTYPVAHASGRTLAMLAPRGGAAAGGFGRFLSDGVAKGFQSDVEDPMFDASNGTDNATGTDAPRAPAAGGRHRLPHSRSSLDVVERTR